MKDDSDLIDQQHIAQRLGCSTSTLRRMVKAGRFPEPIRFVEKGFPRWTRAAFEAWMEAQNTRANKAALAAVAPPESTPSQAPRKPTGRPRGRPAGSGWKRDAIVTRAFS